MCFFNVKKVVIDIAVLLLFGPEESRCHVRKILTEICKQSYLFERCR